MESALLDPLAATEAAPEIDPRAGINPEFNAWLWRRRLPSELQHKIALRWPDDLAELSSIPALTLVALRKRGDHPRLYAIGRALFTTRRDAEDWLEQHALAPGELVRPATIPRGSKRPPRREPERAA